MTDIETRGPGRAEPPSSPSEGHHPQDARPAEDPDGGASASAPRGVPTGLLVFLAGATAISPMAPDMYLAAFPDMARDLGTSSSAVQLTITMYMIGFGVGQYLIGALSDRWGRRGLMLAGLGLTVAASAVAALAPTIGVLWIARIAQGLGAAAGAVLGRAIVSDMAGGVRRAQQLSLMMVIQGLMPVVAPVLGSFLVGVIGWRGIMAVMGAFALVLLIIGVPVTPESLTLENRSRAPLTRVLSMPLRTLRHRRFTLLAASFMAANGILFAYISGSSFVLQDVFGLSATAYGLVFGLNAVVIGAMSALNARLVSRWSLAALTTAGLAMILVGTAGELIDALVAPRLAVFVACVSVGTAGLGILFPNLTTLALGCLPPTVQGSGSAVIGVSQSIGAAVVSPLVGLGAGAVPTALVMAACAALAAVIGLPVLRPGRQASLSR